MLKSQIAGSPRWWSDIFRIGGYINIIRMGKKRKKGEQEKQKK